MLVKLWKGSGTVDGFN